MLLKERRAELHMSCADIEKKLDLKPTRVNKWEHGIAYPRGETLIAYSRLLGLTADEVLNAIQQKAAVSSTKHNTAACDSTSHHKDTTMPDTNQSKRSSHES